MPITVDQTGLVIYHVIYAIPAADTGDLPHPHAVFNDDVRPDPRLLARPDSDPAQLVFVKPGTDRRCAGGPRALIDLEATRRRGASRAYARYESWQRDPATIRLRGWEKTLVQEGQDAFVDYWRLRMPVADALICRNGPALCPTDGSIAAGLRYARNANRLLDALPEDTLIIAATV